MTKKARESRAGLFTRIVARYYLRKPELDRFLEIKYPTLASRWHAAGNEWAYLRKSRRSHRLTAVNIELTNRCNLACVMCPVNRDMSRKKKDLEFDAFRRILDENPALELILMFQWGESLLVPDFFDRVAYAVERGVRVMVTTNGTLLDERTCHRIVASGLDRITISVDGAARTHETIRGFPLADLRRNVERLVRMRDEAGSNLGIDINMTLWEENEEEAPEVRRQWEGVVDRVQFIPRFVDAPRSVPCRELWRGALVVLSDGRVAPCCRDSEGELTVGHLNDGTLEEIWNGEAMAALRDRHRQGDFPPLCAQCGEYATEQVHPRFS